MNQHIARCGEVSRLNYYAWALLAMWTVVVALSLWWNLAQPRPETAVGLWWGHGLLWLLGLGGIIFGFNRLRVAHDRIITLMYTDMLTGIANRRIFLESLGGAISFAQRHQTPLSIIMADLDDFKSVNDTFGHNAGDQVLQAFATLLMENSRQEDLAARFGGEEFIMMLPGTGAEESAVLGERVRRHWQEITSPGFSIRVTASFGVAAYQPGDTVDGFIERADQALYDAKMMGKNQVVVGEDTTEQVEEETRKLSHFLSLFSGENWERKLSVRWREAGPFTEIAEKRSAQRRS
ncbi:MAG: GGDEF domain-containing protein [Deltaproteobacteria bacterium]|nr:MAG: GGDEF domain-containing protein [Deltaproteobacteria bacterium]